jgi:hypothetical protein
MTLKKWLESLNKLATPRISRAQRLSPTWLAVQPGMDEDRVRVRVKDISTTGVYLLTDRRWALGQVFSMELLGEGLGKEIDAELHVSVEARAIRYGEDGVGFAFVVPEGLDPNFWEVLIRGSFLLSDYKDIALAFRMLRAVLFLCRLCPSSVQDAIAPLGGGLDVARTEVAMEIAERAEKLLNLKANSRKLVAHPGLVARILREGSWSLDDVTLGLWAGLLAASSDTEGLDDTNQAYVDLMIHLTPTQARILIAGCAKARERIGGDINAPLPVIRATPEEMIQITGLYDVSRIATDMAYLFHNGLMEELFDFSSYISTESFRITPTALGMKLFMACSAFPVKGKQHAEA